MGQSLSISSVLLQLNGTYTNTLTDSSTVSHAISKSFSDVLSTGTGDDQSDLFWSSSSRTLADAASETFDMYDLGTLNIGAGAGKDHLGQSVSFADVTALFIFNNTTVANDGKLIVGADGTSACWNSPFDGDDDGKLVIPPAGFVALFSPKDGAWAVTDSTNHLLKIAASGGEVTYDIFVVGRSA